MVMRFCTQTYVGVLNGRERHYWFRVPDGMTAEAAFDTQHHFGPFATAAECEADQRVRLTSSSEANDVG